MSETTFESENALDGVRERLDREIPIVEDQRGFFLSRLARFVALREQSFGILADDHALNRLLSKSIYSSYCDCLDLDIGEQAREVLKGENPILSHAA